ncbi:MAG: radical SAM protein [Hymenobacter sp.]
MTDRCNLRCFYCMPEQGIQYLPKNELLSYEEMLRLVGLLAGLGVRKVRLTGGEPFVRRDLVPFMERLAALPGIDDLSLTTNGVLTAPHVPALARLGVRSREPEPGHAGPRAVLPDHPARRAAARRWTLFTRCWKPAFR